MSKEDFCYIAEYRFICAGPDAVVLGKDEVYDGYEGPKKIFKKGQFLFSFDCPDYGTSIYILGKLININRIVKLIEPVEDFMDEKMDDNYFLICSRQQAFNLIKEAAKFTGISLSFILKFVVLMSYDDVINSENGELMFSSKYYENYTVESRTATSQQKHIERIQKCQK